MKCQILFSILFTGKNKKNVINLSSAENVHRVVKVKPVLLVRNFALIFLCLFSGEK